MTQKNYHEIRITIADDHETFRTGLQAIFANEKKFNLVDMVGSGTELLNSIQNDTPDIVLIDIQMPKMDGIEATRQLRTKYPDLGIIALTFKDDDDSIIAMIEAGVNGYLVKNVVKKEILEAIVTVYNGANYFCADTNAKFLRLLKNRNFDRHNPDKKRLFTEKELQIIALICKGLSAKEIATQHHTSVRTVENQKQKIMDKMGARNIANMVMYAVNHRLVEK